MSDLIARLEAATGENARGLEYEIHELLGWRDDDECGWFHEQTGVRTKRTDWPHYTTSLDAALTLVPKGWRWQIHSHQPGFTVVVRSSDAKYQTAGPSQGGTWEDHLIAGRDANAIQAKTPALALCIAALKARS